MKNETVYLNGRYQPLHAAKVSVLDRGFLFGDGVYEVIPCYHGRLFHFKAHMQRLADSLAGIRLANPYTPELWLKIISPLLDPAFDQYIYLQITRGLAEKRDHAFPKDMEPTVFAMASNIVPLEMSNLGVKAVTVDDKRWQLCHIKAINLLANVLTRQEAVDRGSAEAILIRDNHVTEGAASNVFAVIGGTLITPPKNNQILPGITRDVVLELASKEGIDCREEVIPLQTLKSASEIWLTSSVREILPVVELDSAPVGEGQPGPVWQTVNRLFQTHKRSL
ncbi:MAG: D-amino acid aminotransferase [Gammaproteobacteria bacterium]